MDDFPKGPKVAGVAILLTRRGANSPPDFALRLHKACVMKSIKLFLPVLILLAPGIAPLADLEPRLGGDAVYDTDRNVTYLANANLPLTVKYGLASQIQPDGSMIWSDALAYIDFMNATAHLGITEWRLTTITSGCAGTGCTADDFGHLFYSELGGTADQDITNSGDPDLALFTNIDDFSANNFYWSSSLGTYVWSFSFSGGIQLERHFNFNTHFVWPVFTGDPEAASLTVEKTASATHVNTGAPITYTINVTNDLLQDATGVVLTDTLPPGATLAAPLPGHCTAVSAVITCQLGTLTPGSGAQTVIEVLAPLVPGSITNTATVVSNESTVPSTDTAQTVVADATADLSIQKLAAAEIDAGAQNFFYEIHVQNNGPGVPTDVTVTDELPAGMFYRESTVSSGTGCIHDVPTNVLSCGLGGLSGGVGVVTIVVTPTRVGLSSNTATVSSSLPDNVPDNNSSTALTNVLLPNASVTDTINATDDQLLDFGLVTLSQSVGGNLSVLNTGTTTFTIGNLITPLEEPFLVVDPGCFGATLAPGENCSLIIQFLPTSDGSYENNFNLELGNILVPVRVTGSGGTLSADIEVNKTSDVDELAVGDTVNFIISVRNLQGTTADVRVIDKLPNPLRIPTGLVAFPSQGTYNARTGEWLVGPLIAGASPATLEIPAELYREHPSGKGCLTNVANVEITSLGIADVWVANNRSEKLLSIGARGCADLAITSVRQTLAHPVASTWLVEYAGNGPGSLGIPMELSAEFPIGITEFDGIGDTLPSDCVSSIKNNGLLIVVCTADHGFGSPFYVRGLSDPPATSFSRGFHISLCAASDDPNYKNNGAQFRSEGQRLNTGRNGQCIHWPPP